MFPHASLITKIDKWIFKTFPHIPLMENLLSKVISINGQGSVYRLSEKPIAFRPTPKASKIIKDELTKARVKKPKTKPSHIINRLIESSRSEPKAEGEPSFTYPPPHLVLPRLFCPQDKTLHNAQTLLDECKKCVRRTRKQCIVW